MEDVWPASIRSFLRDLERTRGCGIATRHQRLAAIHSLARFIGLHSSEYLEWSGQVRTIAAKQAGRPRMGYLEKDELKAPNRRSAQGRRDYSRFASQTAARSQSPPSSTCRLPVLLHPRTRGRSRTLQINYRTTREIARAASPPRGKAVDNLEDGEDTTPRQDLLSGEAPILKAFLWHPAGRQLVRHFATRFLTARRGPSPGTRRTWRTLHHRSSRTGRTRHWCVASCRPPNVVQLLFGHV